MPKLDVTVIANASTETKVVAEEAEKGYDLLVVGLEKTTVRDNTAIPSPTSGSCAPVSTVR